MSNERNSHCSYCGAPFAGGPWPRTCDACGRTSYVNPIPVSVVLVPIEDGVLLVRRDFGPTKGKLALPGGFINFGESWQEAGAREVLEETCIRISADDVELFRVLSAPDGTLLVFGIVPPIEASALDAFVANEETSECVICRAPEELAFSLHTRVLGEFFAR